MAALLQSPVLGPLPGGRGGGVAPVGGTLAAQNASPLQHASSRKNDAASSSQLTPVLAGPHFQRGTRSRSSGFGARRRPVPPPVLCFFGNGGAGSGSGSGSRRDDTGVEDEDLDIDGWLMRSQGQLVLDVQPLQETRRKEEEAVRKGREMLFEQFRLHLGLTRQEFREMWRPRGGGGGEGGRGRGRGDFGGAEERLRLVRGFLEEEWGWRYRPLSPRAAVEMLDEHMAFLEERSAAAAAGPPPHAPATTTAAAHPRRLLPSWWR